MLLLGTAIGTLGISDAATYFVAARVARVGDMLKRGALVLALSGVVLTVLSFFIAPVLSGHDEQLAGVIRVAGLAITPTLMLGAVRGVAQGTQRWALVNGEKYITAVFRVVPLLVLLFLGLLTPMTAVITLAAAPIVGGLAYIGMFARRATPPIKTGAPPSLVRYGLHVWVGSLSGIVLSRVDQTLMTPLAGVYELGLYAVAVNLADLLLIGQSAIGQVLFAVDAGQRNDERLYLGARLSVAVCAVLALGLGVPVGLWVNVLFGTEFAPAIPAVWTLLLAHVIGAAGSVAGVATSARGRPGLRSAAIAIAALLNLVLLFALVPTFGAVGAAIATLSGSVVGTVLNLYFARSAFGMKPSSFLIPRFSDARALLNILRRT